MKTIMVTQRREDFFKYYKPVPYAFRDWQYRLNRKDKLPRGKYFKGKVAGKPITCIDEFWSHFNTNNSTSFHSLHCLATGYNESLREIKVEDAVTYIHIPTEAQKSLLDITQEKVDLLRKATGNDGGIAECQQWILTGHSLK
jgi:hypothetical protein